MIQKSDLKPGTILISKELKEQQKVIDTIEIRRGFINAFYVRLESPFHGIHGYIQWTLTDIRRYFKLKP